VPAGVGEAEPGESPPASTPDDELWTHVRALPEKQRHALALRVLLDLPYVQVGAIMRTSPVAARRNVFEAISTLRRILPEKSLQATRGPT
jgi:DNA-directed RNA polymerase specialized sigma24 family protein